MSTKKNSFSELKQTKAKQTKAWAPNSRVGNLHIAAPDVSAAAAVCEFRTVHILVSYILNYLAGKPALDSYNMLYKGLNRRTTEQIRHAKHSGPRESPPPPHKKRAKVLNSAGIADPGLRFEHPIGPPFRIITQ